jgi:hypothetical protein
MNRSFRTLAVALPLLALVSCSSSLRMTVSGPQEIGLVPGGADLGRAAPRYLSRDSSATREDGRVVVRGDTLIRLRTADSGASLRRESRTLYRLDRIVTSISIGAYVTADGERHEWPGEVRPRGDSLEFRVASMRAHGLRKGVAGDTLRLALHDVRSLEVQDPNPIGTALGITLAISLLGALMLGGLMIAYSALSN